MVRWVVEAPGLIGTGRRTTQRQPEDREWSWGAFPKLLWLHWGPSSEPQEPWEAVILAESCA